jgi:hypothetical protein
LLAAVLQGQDLPETNSQDAVGLRWESYSGNISATPNAAFAAGVAIGAISKTSLAVLISSVAWGFVAWLLVALTASRAEYRPGSALLFGSPALPRFIVWWTTAAGTSLVAGSIIFVARQAL